MWKKKRKRKEKKELLVGIEQKEVVALQRGYQCFVTDRDELFVQPNHCTTE
jgi:hypothetical protein